MEKPIVLGVDIGGSHITAALVDLGTGTIIQNSIKRNSVNSQKNKEQLLSAWCEVINDAFGSTVNEERSIGIAMPGPFDYEKGISLIKDQDKFNALYLINIKDELAERLNIEPSAIRLINDAAGFVQGEVYSGAGKGYNNVFGLTLGTGLGSSMSINGLAEDAALWDSKFKDGIAEDYLSTRWFVNEYKELSGKTLDGVKELAVLIEEDECVKDIFAEFGNNLGNFLAPIIKDKGSEIVILGGNIAQAFNLFSTNLINKLQSSGLKTDIKITGLNEHAALIGAAICWSLP